MIGENEKNPFEKGLYLEDKDITIPWKCSFDSARKILFLPDREMNGYVKRLTWFDHICINNTPCHVAVTFNESDQLDAFELYFNGQRWNNVSDNIRYNTIATMLERRYGAPIVGEITVPRVTEPPL